MLSCAQELKRRVLANANASFVFMVLEFINAKMSEASGKSSGKRGLKKKSERGLALGKRHHGATREIYCLMVDFSVFGPS